MQRANGDWFALERGPGFRMPVFSSNAEARRAHAFNPEMLVFKPTPLDERALSDLHTADGNGGVSFWLVKEGFANMKHGIVLQYAELASLVRGDSRPDRAVETK